MSFFRVYILFFMLCIAGVASAAAGDSPANADGFLFGDEEQEEKEITSHFECYDLTADVDRTICLNETLDLFNETLQGIYREKVSLAAGNKTFFLQREYNKWLAGRQRKCGTDAGCYINLYKRKIVEMQDNPKVAELQFLPAEGYDSVPVTFFGRRSGAGYSIDRISFQFSRDGKTRIEEFYMYEFLDQRSWELVMPELKLNQLDVNFDHIDDLVFFLGSQGKEGKKVAYLLFDNKTSGFKSDVTLNSLDIAYFNERYGLIHVDWKQEDGRYGTDFYNYSSKGKLQRAFRHSFINLTNKDGSEKVRRIIYRLRSKRNVKIATDDIEKNQIGELPEIMLLEAKVKKISK